MERAGEKMYDGKSDRVCERVVACMVERACESVTVEWVC